MGDPCATPGMTPTGGPDQTHGHTGPLPGLLTRFLSTGRPESSRRLITFVSAIVLCAGVPILGSAIVYQALGEYPVDGQLVTAFLGIAASVAILAGAVFRSPDGGKS